MQEHNIWFLPAGWKTIAGVHGPLWYRINNGTVERHDGGTGMHNGWLPSHRYGHRVNAFLQEGLPKVAKVGDYIDSDLSVDEGL